MAVLVVAVALVGVAVAGGLVVLVLAGIVGRAEADPSGRRSGAVYLGVTTFLAVYLALFSSFGLVVSLASLIGPRSSPMTSIGLPRGTAVYGSSSSAPAISVPIPTPTSLVITGTVPSATLTTGPIMFGRSSVAVGPSTNDGVVSVSLAMALVALAALGVLGYHRRRLVEALAEPGPGPAWRVMTIYRLAVSFVAVFVTALAAAAAFYGVYRIIAPGISGASGRGDGVQELIDAGYLSLGAAAVLFIHRTPARVASELPAEPPTPAEDA
ncbi:MAG TPA: hypothetical protein VNF50_04645 [Acidimicrobiales bacterium]|nr:hypothetical protein [Acidimicrobiales bacterium]